MRISQKQYINKSISTNNNSKSIVPWEFKNSNDISNGYSQSKILSLFNGVSEEMDCGGNSTFDRAYFLLSNPINSSVNIYVKNSIISNHSPNAIITNIYYCVDDIVGTFKSSDYISITNSNSSGTIPYGKIFFGNDLDKIYGIYGQNITVPPYGTHVSSENGSIILSPGFSYLFEIFPTNKEFVSNFVMSFSWWEEMLNHY